MAVTKCPHCGKKYRVPDRALGKKATCQSCKRTFEVAELRPRSPPPMSKEGGEETRHTASSMPGPFSLDSEALPLPAQQQIDAVCIEFEDAWKSGERPDIEGFVSRLPEFLHAPLFGELFLIELDYRRRQGDTPSTKEYQTRFPGLEDLVVAIFERAATPDRGVQSTPSDQSAQETPSVTLPWTPDESGSGAGKRLGRFELRDRLGAGGFGTVYCAYDTMLRREVALKVPHPGRFESEESQARVLREARAAAQLSHSHIVSVYDAGTEGKTFYIASAFVEGETLARFMEERPRDFREPRR